VREEQREADGVVTEVAPGVLRAQLPIQFTGLGHVNCYLLEDERGWAVIDPGLPGPRTWRTLKARLREAGGRIHNVHTVLITHSHPDHFGTAERLRLAADADLVTADNFRTWFDLFEPDVDLEIESRFDTDRRAVAERAGGDKFDRMEAALDRPSPWGGEMPRPPLPSGPFKPVKRWLMNRWMKAPRPTRRVEDGQRLRLGRRDWRVLRTPGHCEDHLCLFDDGDGTLLSGDHVLPSITPHVSGLTVSNDPLADFVTSLDKVDDLVGVEVVLPAHGQPFTDLSGRVAAIKRHHHERLDQVAGISLDLGEADVGAFMRRLFSERAWGNMAESETYAHLEHLRLAGRAEARWQDGSLRYTVAGG
jgi:glyoxylase-like metal-dependent hydrolase (beta-lactamase superfamily II)